MSHFSLIESSAVISSNTIASFLGTARLRKEGPDKILEGLITSKFPPPLVVCAHYWELGPTLALSALTNALILAVCFGATISQSLVAQQTPHPAEFLVLEVGYITQVVVGVALYCQTISCCFPRLLKLSFPTAPHSIDFPPLIA